MTFAVAADPRPFDMAASIAEATVDLRPRFDIRLTSLRLEADGAAWTSDSHVIFLQHLEGGNAAVSFGGAPHPWLCRDMLVVAPGARAMLDIPAPIRAVAVQISERMVRECWSPLLGRPSGWRAAVTGVYSTPAPIFAYLETVVGLVSSLDVDRTSCRTSAVLGLAELLACEPRFTQKAAAVTSFACDAVDRALRAMEDDPALDWSLSKVASVAGVSPYHMSRLFRAAVGCGLQGHLRALRVKKACHLLAETRESLVNVAIDSGFSSQSRMTTVFRAQLGVTPLGYRQRMWGQSDASVE